MRKTNQTLFSVQELIDDVVPEVLPAMKRRVCSCSSTMRSRPASSAMATVKLCGARWCC